MEQPKQPKPDSAYTSALAGEGATARMEALQKLIGPPNDPNIGWRGVAQTSNEHFRCEYCGVEHLDCTLLPHTETCLARALIAAAWPSPAEPAEDLFEAMGLPEVKFPATGSQP
jgi:hypothetical protein